MGMWWSYLSWGGDPDTPDPKSGLSKRDIYVVRKTWALVYADPVGNGTELLKRLFRTYPETRSYFKMIKNLPENEFPSNFQFKAHVINLMSSLNLAVLNLHQPEVVSAMMMKIGESHARRQLKESHFLDLKKVIVQMYIDVLKLDAAALGSWSRTVDFWYKDIFGTLTTT